MARETKVRSIYHLEHYAMEWNEFLDHVHYSEGEVLASAVTAADDEDYSSLGKFDSALDERVWETTLDGGCEETGDVEYNGHHVLVYFTIEDLTSLGILSLAHEFTNVPVGCIVTEVNSGAVDVTYYDTGAELDQAWEEALASTNEYSQEGDGFITFDHGEHHVSLDGSLVGSYDTELEARFILFVAMNEAGYFPSCWIVNDHGNEHRILDSPEEIATMLKDYEEFRNDEEAQAG